MNDKLLNTIILGNSINKLKILETNSIDSIITDPPYELNFMGKKWDSSGISYNIDLWKECLRVLKPGGYLLSFGGTRTYHRITVAIEDAGFEIRDCIMWVYGSGFPKSLNIGKQIDKKQGNKRKVIGKKKGTYANIKRDEITGQDGLHGGIATTRPRIELEETKGETEWEGWGTSLKPAYEPIIIARKPISEKTITENILKWRVGGLNIDDCRISLNGEKQPTGSAKRVYNSNKYTDEKIYGENKETSPLGRFPANFIHDGSDEVLELFPYTVSTGGKINKKPSKANTQIYRFDRCIYTSGEHYEDKGSAARFFYCAKASNKERNEGLITIQNNHPTIKPIMLIRYLCRLVTPKNGTVLDPFGGSGTTAIAAVLEKMNYILIEKNKKYNKIIKERIKYYTDIQTIEKKQKQKENKFWK